MIVYIVEYTPQWDETWYVFGVFSSEEKAVQFITDEALVKKVFEDQKFLRWDYASVLQNLDVTNYQLDYPLI